MFHQKYLNIFPYTLLLFNLIGVNTTVLICKLFFDLNLNMKLFPDFFEYLSYNFYKIVSI